MTIKRGSHRFEVLRDGDAVSPARGLALYLVVAAGTAENALVAGMKRHRTKASNLIRLQQKYISNMRARSKECGLGPWSFGVFGV